MGNKSATDSPLISTPQGGGAISGIGETFTADPHTGTASLTVPLTVPRGRSGLVPDISLVYSSGAGNGLFGIGWGVGTPAISRMTERGIPTYDDDADTFVLSGTEQLVPVRPDSLGMRYRPRTEGTFARITHCVTAEDNYWEVRKKDGTVSLFGQPGWRGRDPAVVRDPAQPNRIREWKLTATTDPFGNTIQYSYARGTAPEGGERAWDQLYLQTIRYADFGAGESAGFLYNINFLYAARPDPFSSRRAGFEIRTDRRCQRVEVCLAAAVPQLIRSYDFGYQDEIPDTPPLPNGLSLLCQIQAAGHDGTATEWLPPLTFHYTNFDPAGRRYQALSAPRGGMPATSLAHPDFALADLFGRGLPDIVQIGDANQYWRNLGGGQFAGPRTLPGLPPGLHLGDGGAQLADCDGDGRLDLLISQPGLRGYFPLSASISNRLRPFVPIVEAPAFAYSDPQVKSLDLDGDGITDAMRTGANFELFYFDRNLGWAAAEARQRDDAARFPDVDFSDARVRLADMTGDGLVDIVYIAPGRIDYWPYFGDGVWGDRLTMSGDIAFPGQELAGGAGFDPRRLLLGDVDGDGAADLLYIESGRVTLWLNRAGNSWSDPIVIAGTPLITDPDSVRLADILGTGMTGILWSYDERTFADSTYKFLSLAGDSKPYLLQSIDNGTGATTAIEYASSTVYYIEDEASPETRWDAQLPFPVQVVARITVSDALSQGVKVSVFKYHKGYWDGEEREFRGFGLVEQLDSETLTEYNFSAGSAPVPAGYFNPPLLTRTWFHQGQVRGVDGDWVEPDISSQVWPGDPAMFTPAQRAEYNILAAAAKADPRQMRHALRALRGTVLRREVYSRDGSSEAMLPYTVMETLADVREVDPVLPGEAERLSVFYPFTRGTRTTQWERGNEPKTGFSFTTAFDGYGLPLAQIALAVPRGRNPRVANPGADAPYLGTYSTIEYAQRDDEGHLIIDRICRTTVAEIVNDGTREIFDQVAAVVSGQCALRLVGHERIYFDGDSFIGLPLGVLGEFGVIVRSESLAFADDFPMGIFAATGESPAPPAPFYLTPAATPTASPDYPPAFVSALATRAGYVYYSYDAVSGSPGGFYITQQRHGYDFQTASPSPRGLLVAKLDPMGAQTTFGYDSYQIYPAIITNALGLVMRADYNYSSQLPQSFVDVNGNRTDYTYSPAGYVSAQYVRGPSGEGDLENPSLVCEYDLFAYRDRQQPVSVRTTRRIHHDGESEVPAADRAATLTAIDYSDGFGRLLQSRAQRDDFTLGDAVFGDAGLSLDLFGPSRPAVGQLRSPEAPPNVAVSGWKRYNNKGLVVEAYEPFFGQGWDYRPVTDAQLGRKSIRYYDPLGRLVRTVAPDGGLEMVVSGIPADLRNPNHYTPTPWEVYTYDRNDNAGRTDATAAAAYSSHWNTPTSTVIDALGRAVRVVTRLGPDPATESIVATSTYDILGNLLSLKDGLGRVALRSMFDLAQRAWFSQSLEAGWKITTFDAVGQPVEARDAKAALVLQSFDDLRRPLCLWARDRSNGDLTLRRRFAYGDGSSVAQSPDDRARAAALNLLGAMATCHDEGGRVAVQAIDFKGNVLEKHRQVVSDSFLTAPFTVAAAADWTVQPAQVNWTSSSNQTLEQAEAMQLGATIYSTRFTYDALNRVKTAQLPADVTGQRRTLSCVYGAGSGVQQLSLDGALYIERIAYNAKGQRLLLAYGNGIMTRWAYDANSSMLMRLRSERFMPDTLGYVPNGGVVQDFGYGYDFAGNLLSLIDVTPGSGIPHNPAFIQESDPLMAQKVGAGDALVRRFIYDPVYRLIQADGRESARSTPAWPWDDAPRPSDPTQTQAYQELYTYDAGHNLVRLNHAAGSGGYVRQYDVGADSNRLARVTSGQNIYKYAYDLSGNLAAEASSRQFTFNFGDQLSAFRIQTPGSEPSIYAQYLQDAAGKRVKKFVRRQGGALEVTDYIDGGFEHVVTTGPGGTENSYIHIAIGGERLALWRLGPPPAGALSPDLVYHLGDHLGSSNAALDATGALLNREEYLPYGETSFGSFTRKRYRFIGQERDEETGLVNCGVRSLAPYLGRWISPDPTGVRGGMNLYRYANDSPLRFTDRAGTSPDDDVGLPADPDNPGSYDLPDEVIYVQARAPPMDDLDDAVRKGLSSVISYDTFQQDLASGARNSYASDVGGDAYYAPWGYDPEGAAAAWDQYAYGEYEKYHQAQLDELHKGWRIIDGANHVAHAAGYVGAAAGVVVGGAAAATYFGVTSLGASAGSIGLSANQLAAGGAASGAAGLALQNRDSLSSMASSIGPTVTQYSQEFASGEGMNLTFDSDKAGMLGSWISRIPGVYDVVAHGTPDSVELFGEEITPGQLLDLIRSDGYSGGPIRLISCDTGFLADGFAQQLANLTGEVVTAPNDEIFGFLSGNYWIPGGSFVQFWPNGP